MVTNPNNQDRHEAIKAEIAARIVGGWEASEAFD
jgi:hypothetical protein